MADRARELTGDMGAKGFEPMLHVELAELARQSGDQEGQKRELHEAHRLFTEIGATGHAERLRAHATSLTSSPSSPGTTSPASPISAKTRGT